MRKILLSTIAAAVLAMPVAARADDAQVQSLIGQLKPRSAGAPIVTRGLPKPGAATAPEAQHTAVAPQQAATQRAATTTTAAPTAAAAPVKASPAAETPPSADLNVLFQTGSANLTPQAVAMLRDLGKALTDPSMGNSRFLIEGHTDTVGDRTGNQVLSERRANAVVEFLTREYRISAERLKAAGVGSEHLLVQTPDQTPEPRNRRVHIVNLDG